MSAIPTCKLLNLHVHVVATRWSSRSLEVERFLRRFDCILDTLSIFENDKDAETSLAAKSLLGTLQTKKFVTLLVFFGRLYDYSDFCTKAFQKSTENCFFLSDIACRLEGKIGQFRV